MNIVFMHTITITPEDIDDMNHVNNVVYVRWVQDAAAAHWNALASVELKRRYAWVVLRHEIDYKNSAKLGDPVKAETWVSSCEGVRSVRNVRLSHGESGIIFAEAVTMWCLLDAVTKRPKRIDVDITSIF
jgi:acyl-CoA thioester hydrolase